MPSGYFLTEMHRVAPMESAATHASLSKSNLVSRFWRFSASSTMKRPRVNLKNSSLEFQSCYGQLIILIMIRLGAYLAEESVC